MQSPEWWLSFPGACRPSLAVSTWAGTQQGLVLGDPELPHQEGPGEHPSVGPCRGQGREWSSPAAVPEGPGGPALTAKGWETKADTGVVGEGEKGPVPSLFGPPGARSAQPQS